MSFASLAMESNLPYYYDINKWDKIKFKVNPRGDFDRD